MDKRSQWQFVITDPDGWKWVVVAPDGTRSESTQAFPTLAACTSNAADHGYVAWKSEDERRRELQLAVSGTLRRQR